MKIYKPIHLLYDIAPQKVLVINKLFSEHEGIPLQSDGDFKIALVRYSPDIYFNNGVEIGKLFQDEVFEPLVMTNYKFLALLLICSTNPLILFSDFSFKNDDDIEESEENRTYIKDLIDSDQKIDRSFEFLKDIEQRISRIELTIESPKNRVVFYSNGNVGLSDSFAKTYFNVVFQLVEFLFTGSLPNEK
ncbi:MULTISPECIES: hypothetical protein [Lactococcus]|uniref:hypothetical protein n=1 Tax=Lactococcus TaxID=1357 RepID=UPI0020BED944|nr:hypothetical protein [Lactococcus petauri]UQU59989.1 hypothetical protein lgb_00750 [Lactococcus petauri]